MKGVGPQVLTTLVSSYIPWHISDTLIETDIPSNKDDNHLSDVNSQANITAFTRPAPAGREVQHTQIGGTDTTSHLNQTSITLPHLKSYQTYSTNSYDRPTYLPQFGINSYSDYSNPPLGGRLPSYSDSFAQISSNPFSANISPVNSAYWSDNRGHHTYTDTYPAYNYNKLSAQYENLNKNTIFRNNVYQESLNRQAAFDTTRSYYRGPHEQGMYTQHFHIYKQYIPLKK